MRFGLFKGTKTKKNLSLVFPAQSAEEALKRYYTGKLRLIIIVFAAGSALTLLNAVKTGRDRAMSYTGAVAREGGMVTLIAEDIEGDEIGAFEVDAKEPVLKEEEVKRLFEEASALMPDIIKGENTSLESVSAALSFPDAVEPYPFRLSYRTDAYLYISYDGSLSDEEIPEEGMVTSVTVTYEYDDLTMHQEIPVKLVRKTLSGSEIKMAAINDALDRADDMSRHEEELTLPTKVGNETVYWKEVCEDKTPGIVFLSLILAAAAYMLPDIKLKRSLEERQEALRYAYPAFVTKLTLYLRAGMSLDGALKRIAGDEKSVSKKEGVLKEEIKRVCNESGNGVSSRDSLVRLSERVSLNEYTRLVNLLNQNASKGSDTLLRMMEAEAKEAVKDKLMSARARADKASTKLMLPMMMMLGIVMFIIMIPAYMSF